MTIRTARTTLVLLVALVLASDLRAAEPSGKSVPVDLNALVGKPVDLAPWAYSWRADRDVQDQPEAYFIPRRLERLDKIYRTAFTALPPQDLKSVYYDMPDLLKPLLLPPKGTLQSALLWTGRVAKYQVELHWPDSMEAIPAPAAVEVRVYPTSFGWFGWTVDKRLSNPAISSDRRTWTYQIDPTAKMDWAYSRRVDAATEMVAVFYEGGKASAAGKSAVPTISVTGESLGAWKRLDLEVEWGFQPGAERSDFDGRIETSMAISGAIAPITNDSGATVFNGLSWASKPAGAARRGVVVPVVYAPSSTAGLDSRLTIKTQRGAFTIRLSDLENGPILIPEQGVFISKANSGVTARQYAAELTSKHRQSICEATRKHPEAASWSKVMLEVRLWTCPPGTTIPPLPQVEDPPMLVELPDAGWTNAWRAASFQLKGKHMWGGLAFEVGRVAHEMDLIGLHDEASKVYEHFLSAPGAKSDGDYSDGNGALELATAMRHDMGYSHDGTHASTGRLLFAMAERYFLTGDKAWLQKNRVRLQAAADWIVRQRNQYMKDVTNREALFVAGLMPPCMLGDYALPTSDWHWYYCDNAFALQGLQRFADALNDVDPEAAKSYLHEADAFRKDLHRAAIRDAELAPVRLGRDGAYHSYIPRMAYARGLTGPELDAPQFPDCDRFMGSLPLAEPLGAVAADDPVMVDTLNCMEEMGTSASAIQEQEAARKQKGLPTADAWFWMPYSRLPKASHNANIYLLQDDVPNFLRFWMNAYASMVGANGKFWEAWSLGNFTDCTNPDNGTAGWFMENFRNLLVMEDGQSLWIARATPRAWLAQGNKISVMNAPTCFGATAYEILSDVDHGEISATVTIPDRRAPQSVLLRFRHPTAAPITGVTVNGNTWKDFDPAKETITLKGVSGRCSVRAQYQSASTRTSTTKAN